MTAAAVLRSLVPVREHSRVVEDPGAAADEEAYFSFVQRLTLARLRVFCVLVVTLVPLFAILDAVVHPGFAGRFLLVRLGMSLIGAILYVIARSERAMRMAF